MRQPFLAALAVLALATAAPASPPAAAPISWSLGAEQAPGWDSLFDQAVKESRPLCVWCGYKCPSSSDQVPGMLHYHAPHGWRDVKGPAVVVLLPNGSKDSMRRAEVVAAEDCCAAELRRAVERGLARMETPAQTVPMTASPATWPTSQPMRAPPLMRSIRGWSQSRSGACVG